MFKNTFTIFAWLQLAKLTIVGAASATTTIMEKQFSGMFIIYIHKFIYLYNTQLIYLNQLFNTYLLCTQ